MGDNVLFGMVVALLIVCVALVASLYSHIVEAREVKGQAQLSAHRERLDTLVKAALKATDEGYEISDSYALRNLLGSLVYSSRP